MKKQMFYFCFCSVNIFNSKKVERDGRTIPSHFVLIFQLVNGRKTAILYLLNRLVNLYKNINQKSTNFLRGHHGLHFGA